MLVDMDAIVRKLLLLGIPLLVSSCGSCFLGADTSEVTERVVDIEWPLARDGGFSQVTTRAYQQCADTGECLAVCKEHLQRHVNSCQRLPSDAAPNQKITVRAQVTEGGCTGRRPEGYRQPATPAHASCVVGAWLAQSAHAEALSVPAFERLASELSAHGAPTALIASARRSAREERQHTRIMTRLARRHGSAPAAAETTAVPTSIRPLAEMAMENAAEGCVRETLGALVARWHSTWATDQHIRAAMQVIARDEARHAELAWNVDHWASAQLSPAARRRLRRVKAATYQALASEAQQTQRPAALVQVAGMPTSEVTLTLARETARILWT